MDYHFPKQLFPSFYNSGPPSPTNRPVGGGTWGSYDRLIPQGGSEPSSSWTFASSHHTKGEIWHHTEPVPIPLFTPKKSLWSSTLPEPLDFREHMQNFYLDHGQDAFGCMSNLCQNKDTVHSSKFLQNILTHPHSKASKYSEACGGLLSDVVPDIPPELLGTLLYEELTDQRDQKLFSERATGGALAFIPFAGCQDDSGQGCLLYFGGPGLDRLNFHTVALQHQESGSFCLDTSRSPCSIPLKAPVRQISCASLSSEHCVAVRSDHLCGVWKYSENNDPCLLQVVNTKTKASCVSASPHVLGEVLVATERGSTHLWTVGKRMQKVREEKSNLYFNANSPWRWCEFSAHPRVMVFADRTGAELTDMRRSPASNPSLFQISRTADCLAGERLITCRYLRDVHPFHHIITTQYSAYLLDERFPGIPMLKMDHMMKSPPMFCHVSSGVGNTKVLLGSQKSQEITLLQYSGGRVEACSRRGPPQALLRPNDSLKQLPVQIPHRQAIAANRLSSSAAGLTCIQNPRGGKGSDDASLCVLQLTEDGDLFYQTLALKESDSPSPSGQEDVSSASQTQSMLVSQAKSTASESSSDEEIMRPSKTARNCRNLESSSNSDASSEDLQTSRRRKSLKGLRNNRYPDLNGESESDDEEGDKRNDEPSSDAVDTSSHLNHADSAERQTPVKLSDHALLTWRRWLQKLVRRNYKIKQIRSCRLAGKVRSKTSITLSNCQKEALSEKLDLPRLRRELKECMDKRSLLVNCSTSSSPKTVVSIPNTVDTSQWQDHLSDRLTLSWHGETAWQEWWKDHLGLNKNEKLKALRRRRGREKASKRASGYTSSLSGSFSSYMTDQDTFSDSSGWCSQLASSDVEEQGSLSQSRGSEEPSTPPPAQCDRPDPSTTSSPNHQKPPLETQKSPRKEHIFSQSPKSPTVSNLSVDGGSSSPLKKLVTSLFTDLPDRSSQNEEKVTEASQPSVVATPLTSSQNSFPINFDLSGSQAPSALPDFSQPSSQGSQKRCRPSQSSQPKKKSRMGF